MTKFVIIMQALQVGVDSQRYRDYDSNHYPYCSRIEQFCMSKVFNKIFLQMIFFSKSCFSNVVELRKWVDK